MHLMHCPAPMFTSWVHTLTQCWLPGLLLCALYKLSLLQEFAAEKELCWDLCMALGLCRRHSALAQALATATLSERHSPMEWQAGAQVGSYSRFFRQAKRLLQTC